jgi:hypothetical protein
MGLSCESSHWLLYANQTTLNRYEIKDLPPEQVQNLRCIGALVLSHVQTKNIFVHTPNRLIPEYLSLLIPDAKIYTELKEGEAVLFDVCIGQVGYNYAIELRKGGVLILENFNLIQHLQSNTAVVGNIVHIENTNLVYEVQ